MFRLAPIVLLSASLCCVATAQAADLAVQKNKQEPAANGSVSNAPSANGSVPGANGTVDADAAAAAQPKPIDKPLPFALAELQLSVSDAGLNAVVHGPEAGFVGVLGLSLTWDLTHAIADLPPLLADAVVVASGFTKTQDLQLKVPFQYMPAETMFLYAQALVIDANGICASGIVPLAIGANGNDSGMAANQATPTAN